LQNDSRHDTVVSMRGEEPMIHPPKTVRIEVGSELDRMLAKARLGKFAQDERFRLIGVDPPHERRL